MNIQHTSFREASIKALVDEQLQTALLRTRGGFVDKRQQVVDDLPEFEQIKQRAATIKQHTLDHLSDYLLQFERAVKSSGGELHWAETGDDANQVVLDICAGVNAKNISKGKSMISEEIRLNQALQNAGLNVVETDLGEYIIQLAEELPSHIIAPAVHKSRAQIEQLFDQFHDDGLPVGRSRTDLVAEARAHLREVFLQADVGITGANFLIAETGSTVLVTNEGNGDLTASIPKVHIVIASIDKVIPKLDDLPTFLRLLGRSATGQELTAYTSLFTGPRREDEDFGPEQFHIILLDNGRSAIHSSDFKPVLNCIRCGACLNHCAVYSSVGGHAYQGVYPGPIGQVLTPLLKGQYSPPDSLSACTLNGHCEAVCPMSIPLPALILKHRQNTFEKKQITITEKTILSVWKSLSLQPWLYQRISRLNAKLLSLFSKCEQFIPLTFLGRNWRQGRKLMRVENTSNVDKQKNE